MYHVLVKDLIIYFLFPSSHNFCIFIFAFQSRSCTFTLNTMMITPATDHRASFARSLSSIHLSQRIDRGAHQRSISPIGCDNNHLDQQQEKISCNIDYSVLKRNRRGKGICAARGSRRVSVDTTVFSSEDLPALPFSLQGQSNHDSSRLHPSKKFQRRRTSAVQEPPSRRASVAADDEPSTLLATSKTFRQDYALGDTVRSPSDMIIKATPEDAMDAADSLLKHDFAFVKRSDGSFTYAILAFRSRDSLTFVMSGTGSTKTVSRRRWTESVRPVAVVATEHVKIVSEMKSADVTPVVSRCFIQAPVPRSISFVPVDDADDCSLISNVSFGKQ